MIFSANLHRVMIYISCAVHNKTHLYIPVTGTETLDELESRVAAETEEKERLRQEHNRSLQELEEQERRQRALQERLKSSQAEIRELQAQLNAKNDTVSGTTSKAMMISEFM